MYKDKRVEKKKTVVMKRCLNPVFNESFAFDIPTERLRETTIVITVMDKDRLSRNDVIGKVGPVVVDGPRQRAPTEGWHPGGQPRPWLMATGAISGWRGRWSMVGLLVLAFPGHLGSWLARTHPGRVGGDDVVAPIHVAMPRASRRAVLQHSPRRGERRPAKSLFIARQKIEVPDGSSVSRCPAVALSPAAGEQGWDTGLGRGVPGGLHPPPDSPHPHAGIYPTRR